MRGGEDTRKERRLKNKDCVYKGWNNVKESVIVKRTVKSHRTYMREGGWWNSVIVSVCMNKTWVIYA
jgi:hypothetical protein